MRAPECFIPLATHISLRISSRYEGAKSYPIAAGRMRLSAKVDQACGMNRCVVI
jgi:hypothetical protein